MPSAAGRRGPAAAAAGPSPPRTRASVSSRSQDGGFLMRTAHDPGLRPGLSVPAIDNSRRGEGMGAYRERLSREGPSRPSRSLDRPVRAASWQARLSAVHAQRPRRPHITANSAADTRGGSRKTVGVPGSGGQTTSVRSIVLLPPSNCFLCAVCHHDPRAVPPNRPYGIGPGGRLYASATCQCHSLACQCHMPVPLPTSKYQLKFSFG